MICALNTTLKLPSNEPIRNEKICENICVNHLFTKPHYGDISSNLSISTPIWQSIKHFFFDRLQMDQGLCNTGTPDIDGNRAVHNAISWCFILPQRTGKVFCVAWLFSQKWMNEPKRLTIWLLHQKTPRKWQHRVIREKKIKACKQIRNGKQTIKTRTISCMHK